ncbi:MAG: hypothetical protein LBS21_15995 [Clostridiales bacterium]|nr:hypothetical protein [Clostridiales bacterium]
MREKFAQKYPNLVTCSKPTSLSARNRRTQALAWKKLYLPESVLVQDGFIFLGYDSLEDLCERAGGFNRARDANEFEAKLILILDAVGKRKILRSVIHILP